MLDKLMALKWLKLFLSGENVGDKCKKPKGGQALQPYISSMINCSRVLSVIHTLLTSRSLRPISK